MRYHGDDGARAEVLDESREEGLSLEVVIVLSGELGRGLHELQGDKLEALEKCYDCYKSTNGYT